MKTNGQVLSLLDLHSNKLAISMPFWKYTYKLNFTLPGKYQSRHIFLPLSHIGSERRKILGD